MSNSDKYRRSIKGLVSNLYGHQRANTRNHGQPIYTKEEFRDWILSQPHFNSMYNDWVDSDYSSRLTPSVDRIEEDKGYTLNNIQLMTWESNDRKEDGRRAKRLSKAVIGISLETGEEVEYSSVSKAARELGISRTHIPDACSGKYKHCGGYTWQYKEQNHE